MKPVPVVVALASLFRAAGITRESDSSTTEVDRNALAIKQAQEFLNRCEDHGIYLRSWERE